MGQEIVYCFKCQRRILGADYAKGLAFQLENNSCCSGCAVQVLDTLPPKAKEQLLGKMFKATHERQSGPAAPATPAAGTRRIPLVTAPLPVAAPRPSGAAPLLLTLGALGVVVLVALIALQSGGSSPVGEPTSLPAKRTMPIPPAPDPGPSSEEKRRTESAKAALEKARDYSRGSPNDFEGQSQRWRAALLDAQGTGYELEARRELEKSQSAARGAAARELGNFEREVRAFVDRKEFKAALDALTARRARPGMPDWAASAEALERAVRDAADRRFGELKDRALAARAGGAAPEVAAFRAEVARWALPDYLERFDAALEQPWRALFDGRTLKGLSPAIATAWRVQDGMLIHDNGVDNAAVFPEFFGDGDYRFRFDADGVDRASFRIRISDRGNCTTWVRSRELKAPGDHELVLSARGPAVTAALDGKPLPVEIQGNSDKGMVQFNAFGGTFRVKSIEFKPVP